MPVRLARTPPYRASWAGAVFGERGVRLVPCPAASGVTARASRVVNPGAATARIWDPGSVIERLALPAEVELLEAERLRFAQVEAPLTAAQEARADRVWADAVRAKPTLFDGPIAASGGLFRDGDGGLEVRWVRATYRRYLGRDVPGVTGWLPHLFAAVLQPTPDGALLVGQMAGWTSAPGRWQFPGGTVEPPLEPGAPLGLIDIARLAARELWEETGTTAAPERLRLWRLMRNPTGDIGAVFRAPALPREELRARYEERAAAERAAGDQPELTRIAFVRDVGDLATFGGETSDYLTAALPALGGDQAASAARDLPSAP